MVKQTKRSTGYSGWLFLILFLLPSISYQQSKEEIRDIRIAFLSDVHIQDVVNYPHLVRTMESQLLSTRLFNENYYAFIAALDDAVEKGVQIVVLPGDLTDDGQTVNLQAMRDILRQYTERHGLSFFVTPGNHDPMRPFGCEYTRDCFLDENGKRLILVSDSSLLPHFSSQGTTQVEPLLKGEGYDGLLHYLGEFGYFPQEQFLYWETPFCEYTYDTYSFDQAVEAANPEKRVYFQQEDLPLMPDVSYLVEPVKGLWILGIDANVYTRKDGQFQGCLQNYNTILQYRKHLLPWIEKVAREAEKEGKVLVTVSHYPMTDFNNGATPYINQILGQGKLDTSRVPAEDIGVTFADAGIRLHFAGHIHINDTEVLQGKKGGYLTNIQVPSLAAYPPAYKLLTIHTGAIMEIETVKLETVPGYDTFFPLYEKEHNYLQSINYPNLWNKEILASGNYYEFCTRHLRELVKFRMIPSLPSIVRDSLVSRTGKELYEYALQQPVPDETDSDWTDWTGFDILCDFYLVRCADKMALEQIPEKRLEQYGLLTEAFSKQTTDTEFMHFMNTFCKMFSLFLEGKPAEHFYIDLNKGVITAIE